ncbi:MAG: preprotein translocase subunit SecE [Candidatus Jorgensenbacteria bacterium]
MFEKLKLFLQESRQELRRVNWPTREETMRYTMFVIALSLGFAVFLGVLDFIFMQALQRTLVL